MDAKLFAKMMKDKSICDFKKMKYKYSDADVSEFVELLKSTVYKTFSMKDFHGNDMVYLQNITQISMNTVKLLLTPQNSSSNFGIKAMEDEIYCTFIIENIESSRDIIRRILNGYAPANDSEARIYGMKKGLDFISDTTNKITETNLYKLYQLAISDFLEEDDKLIKGNFYCHDSVYIMGDKIEHEGLKHTKLSDYMQNLIRFINEENGMNDLIKAAVIHFYFAYLHPYFDGNGRMARLVHLWYLILQGYSSAMFVPFSKYINESRKDYYNAYTLCEQNAKISGVLDATPFVTYFIENVYNKLNSPINNTQSLEMFRNALEAGKITEKEKDLWNFVISAYGTNEFSTKQLEKDFGNVAYATVRAFVMKFEQLELLSGQRYGNKVKYRVKK